MKHKINMRVVPYGAGWQDVYLKINGEEIYSIISYCMGDDFNKLLEVLCLFHPKYIEHNDGNSEGFDSKMKVYKDSTYSDYVLVDSHKEASEILGTDCFTYCELVYKGEFGWCSEPYVDQFIIEKEPSEHEDFKITITIVRECEKGKKYVFVVDYKAFCYAVAKGITDALLGHGITGYYDSVWSELDIRKFIFIKAVALGKLDKFRSRDEENVKGHGAKSNFKKELLLLKKRM